MARGSLVYGKPRGSRGSTLSKKETSLRENWPLSNLLLIFDTVGIFIIFFFIGTFAWHPGSPNLVQILNLRRSKYRLTELPVDQFWAILGTVS